MSESSDQQAQRPDDLPEYSKFIALLVVFVVLILGLAWLSPSMISGVVPAVLGLDGAAAGKGETAVEEMPDSEPEGAAGPEIAAPAEGQEEAGVEAEGIFHEVQEGQTLYQLAALYGVSVEEIAAANNLVNPTQLEAGTVLIIPQAPQ